MKVHELVFTPAYQLADYISSKQLSPVELTKAYLERIEKLNPEINAYLTVAGDQAIADAVISERMVMSGAELGPLHGVPIAVKDMEETAGIRTTFGSLLFEDHVPNTDSLLVKRIRDAGALILGKPILLNLLNLELLKIGYWMLVVIRGISLELQAGQVEDQQQP